MSKLPEYDGSLSRKLRQRDRQAVRQADRSAFSRSGTSVTGPDETTVEGLLKVLGRLLVTGNLDVTGPLAVSGDTDITGATHIGGDTDIDGTLNVDADTTLGADLELGGTGTVTGLLRSENFVAGVSGWRLTPTGLEVNTLVAKDAIIGNAALASPILPEAFSGFGSGFGTATSAWETKASATLTTPAGFTRALVVANSGLTLTNTTGLPARSFVARTLIDTSAGFQVRVSNLDATLIASTGANHTALVTGLTGGDTFAVATQSFTNAAWTASPYNEAGINGVVLWLR